MAKILRRKWGLFRKSMSEVEACSVAHGRVKLDRSTLPATGPVSGGWNMPLASKKKQSEVVLEGFRVVFGIALVGSHIMAISCALVSNRAIVSLGVCGYITEC